MRQFKAAEYQEALIVKARSQHLNRFENALAEELGMLGIKIEKVDNLKDLVNRF